MEKPNSTQKIAGGVERAGVIDLIAYNEKRGEVTLGMIEPRAWDGSEERLFQLQEKFNAYLSFALDGELREAYPQLATTPICIELRCVAPPDPTVERFLGVVREQIAFQGIGLKVRVDAGLGVRWTEAKTEGAES